MTDELLQELLEARRARSPCVLVTVAATTGSVPREPGAKMLVYANGKTSGTVGGGKLEALVIEESLAALRQRRTVLKSYPLHEGEAASFGAICGGEVSVLVEPQTLSEALFLIGAGHCARALSRLASDCGLHVTVIDDRAELLADCAGLGVANVSPPDFITAREWQRDEALIIVSRNFEIDREALDAALQRGGMGYLGMIGSRRKVRHVFEELRARGRNPESLAAVHAPIGLDVGADSPAEIAVSVIAEVLQVLRGRSGGFLRDKSTG